MAVQYTFPFTFRDLIDEEKEKVSWLALVGGERVKFVNSRACCLSRMRTLGPVLYNFQPRHDDVWLIGFPRSGTTLTQEIIYLLGTDLNYEKAASKIMDERFPELFMALRRSEKEDQEYEESKDESKAPLHVLLQQTKEKRFIKSHYGLNFLHPELLQIGCKVIFIARNPKDVIASYTHYPLYSKIPGYSFEKGWNMFKYDLVYGNYFEMLQTAWLQRNNKNMLILFYEEVNADKKAAIRQIAQFLEKNLTDDQLETLLKHIDIDSFKRNKSLNNDHNVNSGFYEKNNKFSFIRQGKNGGWRNDIPPEFVEDVDEFIRKNFSAMTDFKIPKIWQTLMDLK